MEPFGFKSARLSVGDKNNRGLLQYDMESENEGDQSIDTSTAWDDQQHDHSDYDPVMDVANAREMARTKRKISIKTLFRYANWFDVLLMIFGGLLGILSGIIFPWIFFWCGKLLMVLIWDSRCVDEPQSPHSPKHIKLLNEEVNIFLTNVCIGGSALFLCNYVSWRCFAWSADLQMKRMASNYFEWILRKDMAWFDIFVDKEFSNLMNEELTQVRKGIGENLAMLISQISTEFCIIVLTIITHYRLALFLFSMGPLFYILAYFVSTGERIQRDDSAKAFSKAGKLAEDVLCCIKMLKLFQGELVEVKRFSKYLQITAKRQFKWQMVASICTGLIWLFVYSEMAGAIIISTSTIDIPKEFCAHMNKTVGTPLHYFDSHIFDFSGPHSFAIVLLAVAFIGAHSLDIPYYILQLSQASHRAAEIFFLIDWKPRIDNMSKEGKIPKAFPIGRIVFNNVGFKYPRTPDQWAIKHTTLDFYPTQIVGIFGRDNSGKSTILKLIMRLYDPCAGHITIDGVDIQIYNVMWLRSQICFISHETLVFPISITENLHLLNPDCTLTEIVNACKLAEIHDRIIQLPKGYETKIVVGNQSSTFNAQELIKISIARALLIRPKIVLIDEKSIISDEAVVLKLIQTIRTTSTVIFAASRANSIMKHCDHIYYFENGEVVEHGTHLELLHERGPYYKMVEATLDATLASRAKIPSQLAAYKIAKSLRLKNEKKRQIRENKLGNRKDSVDDMLNIMSHPLNEQEKKQFYYSGFGYGGFQKYSFAKSADFNPVKLFNLLKRLHGRRTSSRVMKKKKKRDSSQAKFRQRKTKSIMLTSSMTSMPLMERKDSIALTPGLKSSLKTIPSKTHLHGILTKPVSTKGPIIDDDDDNASLASSDSEEFWDDYCDKIESLRHDHDSGSWCELVRMMKGSHQWIFLLLGSLASIILGLAISVGDILVVETCVSFTLNEKPRGQKIKDLTLLFVGLGTLVGFAAFAQELCFSIAGRNLCTKLRISLFSVMLHQDLEWFDKIENDISILCARLASDVDTVQHILMTTFGVTLQNMTTVAASILVPIVIYFHEWQRNIVLGLSVVTLFVILLAYFAGRLVNDLVNMMEYRLENSSELSYHTISNIKTCIVLGLENSFLVQFNKAMDVSFRCFFFMSELRCIINAISKSLPWIIVGFFVYFSFYYSPTGKHPDIKFLFLVIEMMILRTRNIGEILSLLTKPSLGKIAAHRITKILESYEMVVSKPNAQKREFLDTPVIVLENIRYRYKNTDKEVLKGIDVTIDPNSYVAFIGADNSGKTTLANIMLRLTNPTDGKMLLNGENVEDISIESLRNIMSIVDREPAMLHDMSVKENIRFGNNPNITDDDVINAAKAARVHFEILSLKHGYDTKLDSHSTKFSYFLKHKLSLARALCSNPKILLVDNIVMTENADHDFHMNIAIRDSSQDKTVILFSEKVAPVRQAGTIYVLKDGVIVESGNHSTLLDQQGVYYELYMTQRMLISAMELNVDHRSIEFESQTIETLKEHAAAHAKKKSSIAFTKFLATETERLRDQMRQRGEAMKEEEEVAKMVKKLHFSDDDDEEDDENDSYSKMTKDSKQKKDPKDKPGKSKK